MRYTLTVFRASGGTMTIDWVLGVEVKGDELTFWFTDPPIKTMCVLEVGDHYSLHRDS